MWWLGHDGARAFDCLIASHLTRRASSRVGPASPGSSSSAELLSYTDRRKRKCGFCAAISSGGSPIKNAVDVLVAYGTRPEAIKLAPVINRMRSSGRIGLAVWVTGQHREMLDQVHAAFGIAPDGDLDLLQEGQHHSRLLASVVVSMDEVLEGVRPSLVLVQGDTTTALGVALSAFGRGIPVAHLEAGLRTGNLASPFPEEGNRRMLSQIASLHFAPTSDARANLLAEGVDPGSVHIVGNSVVDALLETLAKGEAASVDNPGFDPSRPYVLVTTHRRESWDKGITNIAQAVGDLALAYPHLQFVIPMHRNPVVRRKLEAVLMGRGNVFLTEPLPYGRFCEMMNSSMMIMTDSGGIQEEVPTLQVPTLILRDTTERPEAVSCGACRLAGTERAGIVRSFTSWQRELRDGAWTPPAENPFGDGATRFRVVRAIEEYLSLSPQLGDDRSRRPERSFSVET